MKAHFVFNLASEDDRHRYKLALTAAELASALSEVAKHLRSRMKYGEPSDDARVELGLLSDVLADNDVHALLEAVGY